MSRRVLIAATLAIAVLWPVAGSVSAAHDPAPPGECPDTMPIGDIAEGQTGIGWTVPRGTEPKPFDVEVVGVFPDGIRPGFDIILIRVSDHPPHQFIEKARGIWAGMSGSPVYIDDKLIGAVAWGFSFGPSKLGGVTPIAEMRKVGDLDVDPADATLSPGLRRALRQATPASIQASDFGQLPLPMILPDSKNRGPRGGTRKKRAEMRARFDLPGRLADRGVSVIPMGSRSRTAGVRVASEHPVPGGNFGASLSFGALKAVGIGTVTSVCDGRVLAFGHDFFLTGRSNMGAHAGTALDVVDDPVFGPFKLAIPGPLAGRVGQDRGAAVAARLDREPDAFRVHSTLSNAGGPAREATTNVFLQSPRFLVWILPADHVFFEMLDLIDAFEDGSVGIDLRVSGKRENGDPFDVSFGDRWIGAERQGEDFFNSLDAGAFGTGLMLSWLVENPFEKVSLDSADVDLDVRQANRWIIESVTVKRNDGPNRRASRICVAPGDELTIRVRLRGQPGDQEALRTLRLTVPRRFSSLRVGGGAGLEPFMDPFAFASLDDLLSFLEGSDRSDDLIARIAANGATRAETSVRLQRVTVGETRIGLRPLGSPGC
jgi:hypothetical protein